MNRGPGTLLPGLPTCPSADPQRGLEVLRTLGSFYSVSPTLPLFHLERAEATGELRDLAGMHTCSNSCTLACKKSVWGLQLWTEGKKGTEAFAAGVASLLLPTSHQ